MLRAWLRRLDHFWVPLNANELARIFRNCFFADVWAREWPEIITSAEMWVGSWPFITHICLPKFWMLHFQFRFGSHIELLDIHISTYKVFRYLSISLLLTYPKLESHLVAPGVRDQIGIVPESKGALYCRRELKISTASATCPWRSSVSEKNKTSILINWWSKHGKVTSIVC